MIQNETRNTVLWREDPQIGEKLCQIRHRSGLRVYLVPKAFGTFSAVYGLPFGAYDRRFLSAGKKLLLPSGTAHFLEHKLFENEDGEDSFEKFARVGANANAYTGMTRTSYVFTCTEKNQFAPALSALLQSVSHPYFTEENVRKEREIIAREIDMYEDDPLSVVYFSMLRAMYRDETLGDNLCGSAASLEAITPKLLLDTFRGIYRPENAYLCLCGNLTPEEILPILDTALPSSQKSDGGAWQFLPQKESPSVKESQIQGHMELPMPQFCIGIKDTDISEKAEMRMRKYACMAILCQALFSGSGSFCPELYEERLVPDEPEYEFEHCRRLSYIALSGQSENPKEVFRRFQDYTLDKAENGISETDIRRAKKVVLSHYLRGFDASEAITAELFSFLCDGGDLWDYRLVLSSITVDEVNHLARELFDENRYTLSILT